MRRFLTFSLILLVCACSQVDVAAIFERYLWEKRVLLVFAPSPDAPLLKTQWAIVDKAQDMLKTHDYVVWVLVANRSVMVDGEAKPHLFTRPFYDFFTVDAQAPMVIVLGKDGQEHYRQSLPVELTALTAINDDMPR